MSTGANPWEIGVGEAQLRANAWPLIRGFLLVLGTVVSICFFDRLYAPIVLSLVWFPYVLFNPREGLWISPGFIMVADLICAPEGFVAGAGYSPELTYWAVGVCVLFTATLIPYLIHRETKLNAELRNGFQLVPSRGFYAFAAISVVASAVGLAHGYALQNVAKQFFGCALLCGYFLFVLQFAPAQKEMEQTIRRLASVAVLCSIIYSAIDFSLFSIQNFSAHLTPMSFYDGGLFVLLLPHVFNGKTRVRIDRTLALALFFFAIPVLTQMKKTVVACLLCGLLTWGLRSVSRRKRYLYLFASFLILTILVSTSVLNPLGVWFSKYESLKNFFPEDVQSHYSVFLRVEEFRQVIGTFENFPVLGAGLGSTVNWYDPVTKTDWEVETVGDGLLYLLVKMGIVGTVAFTWFVGSLGVAAVRRRINGLHLALFLLFIFHMLQMVADVTFFYFLTAGWVGTTCAYLHILNTKSAKREVLVASRVA